MGKLPIKVEKSLMALKKTHEHYIEVKFINGLYCLFESRGVYDKERKKTKKVTHYLGRILESGKFVEAKHRVPKTTGEQKLAVVAEAHDAPFGEQDAKLLTALSMNGRLTYVALGKLVGLSKNAVRTHINRLQKRYGIKLFAEIDTEKLGYLGYITFVKFLDTTVPALEDMKRALEAEPMIQMALLTKGDYDIALYSLAKGSREMSSLLIRVQNISIFRNYRSKWYTTLAAGTYGFVPVRERFFELLEKDVFVKGQKVDRSRALSHRELIVLRELSSNGAVEFSEIDKKEGLDNGAAQYAYYSLVKKGIIRRITANATTLPIRYNAIILTEVVHGGESDRTRPWFLTHIIEDTKTPTSRYAFVSTIEIPKGGMLVLPVFEEGELENDVEELKRNMKGVEVHTLIITNIILGHFCYRNFDKMYSSAYEILVGDYKTLKPQSRVNYSGMKIEKAAGKDIYIS